MSKTKEETQQPSVYDDLLKNGTAVLEAPTREALAETGEQHPSRCVCRRCCWSQAGRKCLHTQS